MKRYYFLIIHILTIVALSGCTQWLAPQQETSPSLKSETTVQDRFYKPEVVRYGRYLLADTTPTVAQRAPLEQIIDIRIPASDELSPNVGDAINYILQRSGYSLCHRLPASTVLYRKPLPAVHYQLGPIRLSEALQILAGSAWQLEVDATQREVCYSLRDDFQLPVGVTVKPIFTSEGHFDE